ncbi:MAG TPA: hypothetical protein VFH51_12440, partial [Myxococcota bacterium]|nr:hypothetical protein [Myxococcota bacterium]
DPGCAFALSQLYDEVGVRLPPVQTTLSLLAGEGERISGGPWAPHEACFSARWLREPGLRERLTEPGQLVQGSVLEGEAGCCGGMLLPLYDASLADAVARARAKDVLGGGAGRILSASPTCSRRLRAVGAPVDDVLAAWFRSRG